LKTSEDSCLVSAESGSQCQFIKRPSQCVRVQSHPSAAHFQAVNIFLASVLLMSAASVDIAVEGSPAAGGSALADLWIASAAEYQATAEAELERLGARNIQQADLTGAIVAGFLQMFSGGGGAPLDLVRPRADAVGIE
jgi:hypothetical protein